LRIPDLPNQAARDALEAKDRLIKQAHLRPLPKELHKASPDDPKHPGWPAGAKAVAADNFVRKTERRSSSSKRQRSGLRALP
jgi:hypothetical protein